MRLLLSGSILILLLCNCGRPYSNLQKVAAKGNCPVILRQQFNLVLYNTIIDVAGKHFSGLLLLKKMEDKSIRVVFSNEVGMKFFDFEFTDVGFKVVFCNPELNRKFIISLLRKDIGLVLYKYAIGVNDARVSGDNKRYNTFKSGMHYTTYMTDTSCTSLLRIEYYKGKRRKIIVNLDGFKKGMADSIMIKHDNLPVTISLKQIER